jgi:hypothetical protein
MTLDALPPFVPGLALSERFFRSAVEPLLTAHFPELRYAAGRLGCGSDVMGFDTPQSRDHHWGPKTTLFLTDDDLARHGEAIAGMLGERLPFTVDGYPTHFDQPDVDGGFLTATDRRPVAHGVSLTTIARFTHDYLGVDATKSIDERAWLAIPSQRLRTVRAGRVFHDDLGLAAVRARLHWYPRDVWLYRMANQWRRIDQEEPWGGPVRRRRRRARLTHRRDPTDRRAHAPLVPDRAGVLAVLQVVRYRLLASPLCSGADGDVRRRVERGRLEGA